MANQGAHQVSPLAPAAFPELPPIAGVTLAAAETGIRYKNRPDVLLLERGWVHALLRK